MLQKITTLLLLTFNLFFLTGCSSFKAPVMKGIEKIDLGKIGLTQSTLSFNVLFHNPNKIGLKLKTVNGNAWVDGNPLGDFVVDTLIKIPKNADFNIPVKLKLDMKHFVENMSTAFLGKKVLLKLKGTARIGKGMVFKNYPIEIERKEALNDLLK